MTKKYIYIKTKNNIPVFPEQLHGTFWGITTYFNFQKYKTKLDNYKNFRESNKKQGLNLLTVELAYGNAEFELSKNDADILIQLRTNTELWQKERLLNVALNHLPDDCDKICWLDCDITFQNNNWIKETSHLLEKYKVVQPFDFAVRLPKDNVKPEKSKLEFGNKDGQYMYGIGYGIATYGKYVLGDDYLKHGSTGFAWAARKNLLDKIGFYDKLILGSSDLFMAKSYYGDMRNLFFKKLPEKSIIDCKKWTDRIFSEVSGSVYFTQGEILHLWHGAYKNKNHKDRYAVLIKNNFDLDNDIKVDINNCWAWATDKPKLHKELKKYFWQRNEDGSIKRQILFKVQYFFSLQLLKDCKLGIIMAWYNLIYIWLKIYYLNIYPRITKPQFKLSREYKSLEIYKRESLINYKNQWASNSEKETKILIKDLIEKADKALKEEGFSVTRKTTLPPSKNIHDYLSINNIQNFISDEKNYTHNEHYDNADLISIFRNSTILTLAWVITDNEKYAEHAIKIIRTWFINPETKMNPNLKFAQFEKSQKNKKNLNILFEANNLYFFLDALLILKHYKNWKEDDQKKMTSWCNQYLNWILKQKKIYRSKNNYGIFYDTQVVVLSIYIGKYDLAWWFMNDTQTKIQKQFRKNGEPAFELETDNIKYYSALNLLGWVIILKLGKTYGLKLLDRREDRLKLGFQWFLNFKESPWPFNQISDFDEEIFSYLQFFIGQIYPDLLKDVKIKDKMKIKSEFHPYYCINPFWQLGV